MFGIETYKKLKTVNRLRHILIVFGKAGFSYYIHQHGFGRHLGKTHSPNLPDNVNFPKRFRQTLEDLGPVFVKFGQILSTRWDLLPPEYIAELESLQSRAQTFSYEEAVRIIEKEFKKPLGKVFKTFEKKPFAAASLGQVYRASLFTGEIVAVKVQRPKAAEQVELDTRALTVAAHLAEKYVPNGRSYNLSGIVQEFKRWTTNELDYRKEATNCEVFDNFFKDHPHIFAPKVYWDYCGKNVLTLQYIAGTSLTAILKGANPRGVNKKQLVEIIGEGFLRQYFEYGYFHADPHPGNILVLKNNKVVFLDFGMVGFLDEPLTVLASNMFLALVQKDVEKLVSLSEELNRDYSEADASTPPININGLRKELNQMVLQRSTEQAAQFTRIFFDLLNTAVKYNIAVPVDLVMLSKSLLTLDTLVTQLNPDLNLASWEGPLVERIVMNRLKSQKIKARLENAAVVADGIIKNLPETTAKILYNLEHNKFGNSVSPEQLKEYEKLLNQRPPGPSIATLLITIVVASALTYSTSGQPALGGWPISHIALYGGIIGLGVMIINHLRKA